MDRRGGTQVGQHDAQGAQGSGVAVRVRVDPPHLRAAELGELLQQLPGIGGQGGQLVHVACRDAAPVTVQGEQRGLVRVGQVRGDGTWHRPTPRPRGVPLSPRAVGGVVAEPVSVVLQLADAVLAEG
ncbi:hypothetical protein ACH492_39340 [Streptomyces sp. NPDC019443]|uniref:hypothetical protein n=1 Tax=Streptomyces sp. NPDC019443 TaxID=3365061 RepID=UPI0037A709A9